MWQLFKHLKDKDRLCKCTNCNKKTWHHFIRKEKVIKVVNRSGPKKSAIKHNYICVLRANEYYLHEYSVYKCIKCGKCKNFISAGKRISKEEANTLNLKMLSRRQFLSFARK